MDLRGLLLWLLPAVSLQAQPYQPVPSRIEAESYINSGNVFLSPATDEGGGQEAGWMNDGAWMAYRVNASSTGYYTFHFRIANGFSDDARLELLAPDDQVLAQFTVPRTGGMNSWKTVPVLAFLPQGNQTIKIRVAKGVFSLNWVDVAYDLHVIPGKIEAEDFQVAHEVKTEPSSDTGGGLNVGYIDDGDWMDYHVAVTTAGNHLFRFRVANLYGNGIIQLRDGQGNVLGQTDVIPQTGGWQNWTTVTASVSLPAGHQVLRLFSLQGGAFNVNWMEITEDMGTRAPAVIRFDELPAVTAGGASFYLTAYSNHTEAPVRFTSSNPSVLLVTETPGGWLATPVSEGTAIITAYQAGSTNFLEAALATRTQAVNPASAVALEKIPVDPERWYILNNATHNLQALFDGKTNENVHLGWGMVLRSYEAYYPLLEGEEMTLEQIRMFDFEGIFKDNPATLSVITSDWQRIPVATFTGEVYNGWVGPYPDRGSNDGNKFRLDSVISGIRYLVLNIQGGLPTELELYGTYRAPDASGGSHAATRQVRLKDMLGVNAYEWNFQDGQTPDRLNESKVDMVKSFSGIRHYMDWEKLEIAEGLYSYNPTLSGGWHYDQIYERCKAEGIEVLACLKTLPGWMQATYPAGERDSENIPVKYGKNFADPRSYVEQAKVAFQYAARYGSNTTVDPSLLSVHQEMRWPGDIPNSIRIGTGLIRYIECDNERDKWWKGRKAYQTAREYAANLSAFYDGHQNSMGPGVGVKNADPEMKVVIAGLVSGPEYIRGMVDWCREFRGYKPDGSVDLCWDIINYHHYTDNASSSQSGTSTRGAAPEVTDAGEKAAAFIRVSDELCYGMPVWITEAGYDLHQDSPLKAVPVGSRTQAETQADWILRTSLFYARHGISKVFFYQMYDDNPFSGGMFSTSGLVNDNLTRRPAADYLNQARKLFGEYDYKETISQNPVVDRYESGGNSMYVMVVPEETGQTRDYSLSLDQMESARVYRPEAGAENMDFSEIPTPGGILNLTVGETPLFVVPHRAVNARKAVRPLVSAEDNPPGDVLVYPNPVATGTVLLALDNTDGGKIEVHVFDASLGMLHHHIVLQDEKQLVRHQIDVSALPSGNYIMDIRQKNRRTFKKISVFP